MKIKKRANLLKIKKAMAHQRRLEKMEAILVKKVLSRKGFRNRIKIEIMRVKVILDKMMVIRDRIIIRIKKSIHRQPLLLMFLALIK
ncbi:MAG: hypothetical protein EBQ87_10995 [Planctomycetes bacterium]|nr:hypothetical protein [Planctomycetota bacterium]